MTLLLAILAATQDPKEIDAAIDKGAAWLLQKEYKAWEFGEHGTCRYDELVLLTLLHAGVDRADAKFQALLKQAIEAPLERTYCVSLQAMALCELDPVRYQWRIAQCCQFLVDNQLENGQWNYGSPTTIPKETPSFWPGRDVETGGGKPGKRPKVVIRITPQRKGTGPAGDNSNSQYAALGLRASIEANVIPPRETLQRARKWWEEAQQRDGGWGYREAGTDARGSMTAGALSSLILCKHYLGEDWRSDGAVKAGFRWLAANFSVEQNSKCGNPKEWYFYYLYALERVGLMSGQDRIGGHDWYREGARKILDQQQTEGFWSDAGGWQNGIAETCFAILFLRRATIPLPKVASK